ncbi:DUF2283 domain-containing protein [Leptospirillum ferrooxidans]|jgi:uncharacterized protein YuzE|uniref:DUF2283 domain-containing protein n=1 Tax=Leptospirillum ferrooxidans (strain C2-3) TaxID=1162668 RepID=I0IKR7_LEPFC|nr:DUF2283 domain-containing protein [Leptospirillum ferrooxidans]BAM05866.1 hypothetical protein LFE_0138 [Leptospirillum ferrooxidans C2-3]
MRVRVDQQADAIYLDLTGEKIESSEEVADGTILDYDRKSNMVGIEILDASKKTGEINTLQQMSLDVATFS